LGSRDSDITFNKKYEKLWSSSKACVAVVNEDISIEPGDNRALLKSKCRFSHVSGFRTFYSLPVFHVDIHPTAVVDKYYWTGARIGAGSYVGQRENWRKCNPIS
jgi:UDP-3-O-[3-hydroxymyristoyl] glucosamine N-acyltransferase